MRSRILHTRSVEEFLYLFSQAYYMQAREGWTPKEVAFGCGACTVDYIALSAHHKVH